MKYELDSRTPLPWFTPKSAIGQKTRPLFGNSDYVKTENRIFKDIEDEIENIDKALKNIMYYYFDFEKDMNMIYK